MIIQAISYGGVKEEPFSFTYSGNFTDNRVDGVGKVRLNTSGTLTVTSGTAIVSAYILGGGGGAACNTYNKVGAAGGGGGGYQTIEVELSAGNSYEITIGTGGSPYKGSATTARSASGGGSTTAFGKTSTGGGGGTAAGNSSTGNVGGAGGTPNGGKGATSYNTGGSASGGSPNGGSSASYSAKAGGNGYVELTFS